MELLPLNLKQRFAERKAQSVKFDALQTFIKVMNLYTKRLRSIVLMQHKVAQCRFFGIFAPSRFLRADYFNSSEDQEQLDKALEQSLVCFSPSGELSGYDLSLGETVENKLAFEETLPTNFFQSRLQKQLAANPADREKLV